MMANALTKINPVMARNTIVATMWTGLNVYYGIGFSEGWVGGIGTLRTSLSCALKPIRNPVPAREMIVPKAHKTAIADKFDSVNDCAQI